jgi:hypothetical protein
MNINYLKYIFIIFLFAIFFIYGLILSQIIDFIFPSYNENNCVTHEMVIEIIGEIALAYLIYFCFKHYIDKLILFLFKNIHKNPPSYLNQLLLFSFSFGIFKDLHKSNNKIDHYKKKVFEYVKVNYIKDFSIKLPSF